MDGRDHDQGVRYAARYSNRIHWSGTCWASFDAEWYSCDKGSVLACCRYWQQGRTTSRHSHHSPLYLIVRLKGQLPCATSTTGKTRKTGGCTLLHIWHCCFRWATMQTT